MFVPDEKWLHDVAELYFTVSSKKDIKQIYKLYKDGISPKEVIAMAEAQANG